MPDTAQKEKIAEHEIASILSRRSLLIAKPYFDQRGADLLAFIHICGGAKFCRIQAKYRQEQGNVAIPVHYVPGSFACIVYLAPKDECNDPPRHILLCFFPDDIRQWNNTDGTYTLYLPKYDQCKVQFAANELNDTDFQRLQQLIVESTVQDEMGMMDFSNPNNSGLIAALGS